MTPRIESVLRGMQPAVLIGPLGCGKTTVTKRWIPYTSAITLKLTDKATFRKGITGPSEAFVIDRLDLVAKDWQELIVQAIESGKPVLCTFDGTRYAFNQHVSRHLKAKLIPLFVQQLSKEQVEQVLRQKLPNPSEELVKTLAESGNVGWALSFAATLSGDTSDVDRVREALEVAPDPNEPDAPTVHGGKISDAMSALIKEIRRGDVREAVYWAAVLLLHYKVPLFRVARRVVISASEDHHDARAYLLANAMMNTLNTIGYNTPEARDHVMRAIAIMTTYDKWWDNDLGIAYQERHYVEDELIADGAKEVPSYACDMHTMTGKQMERRGEDMDLRLSGAIKGQMNMLYLAVKSNGKRTPFLGTLGYVIQGPERPTDKTERSPFWRMPKAHVRELIGERLSEWRFWGEKGKKDADIDAESSW